MDIEGCISINFILQWVWVLIYFEYNFGDVLFFGCVGDIISLVGIVDSMFNGVDVVVFMVEGSFQ